MTSMEGKVLSPSKLAHVVLQTNKFEHMKRFYLSFLGGRLVKESGPLAFITYVSQSDGQRSYSSLNCGREHRVEVADKC